MQIRAKAEIIFTIALPQGYGLTTHGYGITTPFSEIVLLAEQSLNVMEPFTIEVEGIELKVGTRVHIKNIIGAT